MAGDSPKANRRREREMKGRSELNLSPAAPQPRFLVGIVKGSSEFKGKEKEKGGMVIMKECLEGEGVFSSFFIED